MNFILTNTLFIEICLWQCDKMGKTIVLLILFCVFADKTVSFPGKSNSTDVFNCWHSRIPTVKGKGDSLFECRSQTKTLTCAYPSELRCIHSGFFKCRKNKMDTNNQDETYNIRILCRSNKPHRLIASFSVEICKQNSKGQFQLSCSENIHSGRNITSNTKEHLDNASPSFKKFHDSRGGRFKRDVNDITASTNQVCLLMIIHRNVTWWLGCLCSIFFSYLLCLILTVYIGDGFRPKQKKTKTILTSPQNLSEVRQPVNLFLNYFMHLVFNF